MLLTPKTPDENPAAGTGSSPRAQVAAPEPRQAEATPAVVFKLVPALTAAHTTCRLYAGPDRDHLALCGELRLRHHEYSALQDALTPPAQPTNISERPEDAVRRFALELVRLGEGLSDRGIPLRDGPVHGAPVDTALAELDALRRYIEARDRGLSTYEAREDGWPATGLGSVPQDRTRDGVPEVEQAGPGNREPDPREVADHHLMTALGVHQLDQVMPAIERLVAAAEQACRGCGCTQDRACAGGCSWAELGDRATGRGPLCSACASWSQT